MNYDWEYCNPFDGEAANIWMKLEHAGRYLYALDFVQSHDCQRLLEAACADGYGAELLSTAAKDVIAADRNEAYLEIARTRKGITCFQLDFDQENFPEECKERDAIISLETVEHLQNPWGFLRKLYDCLKEDGWLLLSFPNERYEQLDEEGKNKDPFHLHIFKKEEMITRLQETGFVIEEILGQSICNRACSAESFLKKKGKLFQEQVDRAFRYDRESICTMARILAYPQDLDVEESYSYLILARKQKIAEKTP